MLADQFLTITNAQLHAQTRSITSSLFKESNCRSILFLAPSCATKVTTKSTWIVSGLNYFSLSPRKSAARGKANKRVPTCWTIKVVFNRNKSESPQNVNFDRKISPSEKPNKSSASAAGIEALGRTKDEENHRQNQYWVMPKKQSKKSISPFIGFAPEWAFLSLCSTAHGNVLLQHGCCCCWWCLAFHCERFVRFHVVEWRAAYEAAEHEARKTSAITRGELLCLTSSDESYIGNQLIPLRNEEGFPLAKGWCRHLIISFNSPCKYTSWN